jgi:hypothetical protein
LVFGLLLKAAGLGWIAMVATSETSYAALLIPMIVEGIGTSMAIPVVQSAMLGAVKAGDIGKASGINGVSQELGGVFGVAILVALFTTVGSYVSAAAFADGFTIAIGACAAFALGAAVIIVASLTVSGGRCLLKGSNIYSNIE